MLPFDVSDFAGNGEAGPHPAWMWPATVEWSDSLERVLEQGVETNSLPVCWPPAIERVRQLAQHCGGPGEEARAAMGDTESCILLTNQRLVAAHWDEDGAQVALEHVRCEIPEIRLRVLRLTLFSMDWFSHELLMQVPNSDYVRRQSANPVWVQPASAPETSDRVTAWVYLTVRGREIPVAPFVYSVGREIRADSLGETQQSLVQALTTYGSESDLGPYLTGLQYARLLETRRQRFGDPVPEFRPRLIRSYADAEQAAADWMRGIGFMDATVTAKGADGGIDVESRRAVAQVKAEVVPTGRPVVQQLYGVARSLGKAPFFFSLAGYSEQAIEWAKQTGVYLFRFDLQGEPSPVTPQARELLSRAIAPQLGDGRRLGAELALDMVESRAPGAHGAVDLAGGGVAGTS